MKNLVYILLALLLLAGCGGQAATETTAARSTAAEDVLAQRRQLALEHMRGELSFYWTCDVPLPYYRGRTGILEITYQPGRIYRGIPYGGSGGTKASFLRYGQGADERGVHALSGFAVNEETGEASVLQLGSDCSTSVFNAWNQVANSIRGDKRSTKYMTENNGYLRVGSYESDPDENAETIRTCKANGEEVMYAAYSLLQPADAVVHNNGGIGHAMMITQVSVATGKNGQILGNTSFVTIMDQTSGNQTKEVSLFDETIGAEVYPIGNLEKVYTFAQLYEKGYLPITCKELIDPSPVSEALGLTTTPQNGDDLAAVLQANTLESSRAINLITLTVTDRDGNAVAKCDHVPKGSNANTFALSRFLTEPSHLFKGDLLTDSLPAGSYTLRCEVLTVTGKTQAWTWEITEK